MIRISGDNAAKRAGSPGWRCCHWSVLVLAAAIVCLPAGLQGADDGSPPGTNPHVFNPQRAYQYLQKICRIGPRASGSHGMAEQQSLLADHFSRLGAQVSYQPFDAPDPIGGQPVRMSNLIVSWHPKSTERVLIACHYDTRPFPERDRGFNPQNPRGTFLGANDGASGVAMLMEMGNQMPGLAASRGVDFVFFDGEEFVLGYTGNLFHGSNYFSKEYRDHPPAYRYAAGVLVDMVGDKDLNIYMEKNSVRLAPAVTRSVWQTAKSLGIREFFAVPRYEISDDHLSLNEIARIPTCDVIDFDYPYWHTSLDRPDRCSGQSLAKVGRVLLRWITEPPGQQGP
jgi:glutaminyl-peptide cyclotransferase